MLLAPMEPGEFIGMKGPVTEAKQQLGCSV